MLVTSMSVSVRARRCCVVRTGRIDDGHTRTGRETMVRSTPGCTVSDSMRDAMRTLLVESVSVDHAERRVCSSSAIPRSTCSHRRRLVRELADQRVFASQRRDRRASGWRRRVGDRGRSARLVHDLKRQRRPRCGRTSANKASRFIRRSSEVDLHAKPSRARVRLLRSL